MARWVIAYIRDSCNGLLVGARQAATAASPAFSFQALTASDRTVGWAFAGAAIAADAVAAIKLTRSVRIRM